MQQVNVNTFKWSLYPTDNINKCVLGGNMWDPHIVSFLTQYLKKGDIAIDIGASVGFHTLQMAKSVGDEGSVIAFEPNPFNIDLLRTNISNNNINNIKIYSLALGHETLSTYLCHNYNDEEDNNGDSYIAEDYYNEYQEENTDAIVQKFGKTFHIRKTPITMTKLDSFDFKSRVNLIKIDTQGFEKMILQGAVNLIKKDQPVLIIEIENEWMNKYGYDSGKFFSFMESLDYVPYLLDYCYPCDHIFVHKDRVDDFENEYAEQIKSHHDNNPYNDNVSSGVSKKFVPN